MHGLAEEKNIAGQQVRVFRNKPSAINGSSH
jgi:hypothetical protein